MSVFLRQLIFSLRNHHHILSGTEEVLDFNWSPMEIKPMLSACGVPLPLSNLWIIFSVTGIEDIGFLQVSWKYMARWRTETPVWVPKTGTGRGWGVIWTPMSNNEKKFLGMFQPPESLVKASPVSYPTGKKWAEHHGKPHCIVFTINKWCCFLLCFW